MLDNSWSIRIIRLCGLLPVASVKKNYVVSKFWYFYSYIIAIIVVSGSIYRFHYTTVAEDYQAELHKIGYIFDILTQIEPLIIVVMLCQIFYSLMNISQMKKQLNFLNSLYDLFDTEVNVKMLKVDRFIAVLFLLWLSMWLLIVEWFYQEFHGILDLSRHIDVIFNYFETIIVGVQSFYFVLYFCIFLVAVSELEKQFKLLHSRNIYKSINDKLKDECLKKYDILLHLISQFEKIHGFSVKFLIIYAYFDVVAAVKGFIDVSQTEFSDSGTKHSTIPEDLLTSFWYLCHIPHLLVLICVGEIIENKVCLDKPALTLFLNFYLGFYNDYFFDEKFILFYFFNDIFY